VPDVMLALTNAKPGRDESFNAWYDSEHLPAVLAADHRMIGARRLRVALSGDGLDHPYEFLALYEVELGQVAPAAKSVLEALPPLSDDVDARAVSWWFEELGPRRALDDAGDGPFDKLVVLTNSLPGQDDAFNAWYDGRHVPDLLEKVDGVVAAQRFRRAEGVAFNKSCPWGYLALYDIPQGEARRALEGIVWSRTERSEAEAAGRDPQVPITPAMAEQRVSWWYREITPYVRAESLAVR
jgi:hypothetical protein